MESDDLYLEAKRQHGNFRCRHTTVAMSAAITAAMSAAMSAARTKAHSKREFEWA